ncbi:MAG: sulfate reduction electron transfer complex DsrMKJOP subunit DsrP [Planctomycetota bacterium]|jgi:molybdopterin-containing oxidoreductase family membrane subunit
MRDYAVFLWRCGRLSFVGDWKYYAWLIALSIVVLAGLNAYSRQFVHGLIVTGLTDQVSWGMYIANFAYLVGIASSAVMVVIPVYMYKNHDLHDLVIFGQLLAVAAIIMCLLFVMVDLGRPDRSLHLMLRFNFPISMLTWDVVVLNGYLLLNTHICGYLIYCAYRKRMPTKMFYIPFVFVTIFWAVSIQLVEAFLISGLGSRPFWNTAVLAPRFITSAFAAGPAIMIITLQIIRSNTPYTISDSALHLLRRISTVALSFSMFLLIAELFTEFYTGSAHAASARYLFLGLHGYNALVPWIWTGIGLNVLALGVLWTPFRRHLWALNGACVAMIVGIWIEKGMGLIVPGFIPSPIGEIVEYTPTLDETLICLGIWAFGLIVYTICVRITIPVLQGRLTIDTQYHPGHQVVEAST